jgi:hypothetical protein
VTKVREGLAMNKQTSHRFHMETFNLKKLNEVKSSKVKVKLSLYRLWRLPHFQTFGSQMAARLSALCAGCFLPPGRFLVLVSVRG